MPDLIGQYIGRYHILERLGEGGMATVYKAFDTRLEAEVAIKVIRVEELPPKVLDRALKRFAREAKALARLTHPNIVRVIDTGEHEGAPYLVMPYLPGGSLKQVLRERGRLPWEEALQMLIPIARALGYAHRQGMIHRDVKPSNILITEDGELILTDFGIAKILGEETTVDLTGTRALVGTPEYMAPEQVTSRAVDARVDIYALGVVLYEMLTGRKPYQADTPMAVMIKHVHDPLPRPREFVPDLPEEVERILLKALAKDPDERYQTMDELAAALARALVQRDIPPAPVPTGGVHTPVKRGALWPWISLAVVACIGGTLLLGSVIKRWRDTYGRLVSETVTMLATTSEAAGGTVAAPTATPSATKAPRLTATTVPVVATVTGRASPTSTLFPSPSDTPRPTRTNTPTPSPTSTPTATDTPLPPPTRKPLPTNTLLPPPTATPVQPPSTSVAVGGGARIDLASIPTAFTGTVSESQFASYTLVNNSDARTVVLTMSSNGITSQCVVLFWSDTLIVPEDSRQEFLQAASSTVTRRVTVPNGTHILRASFLEYSGSACPPTLSYTLTVSPP